MTHLLCTVGRLVLHLHTGGHHCPRPGHPRDLAPNNNPELPGAGARLVIELPRPVAHIGT